MYVLATNIKNWLNKNLPYYRPYQNITLNKRTMRNYYHEIMKNQQGGESEPELCC